MKLLLAEDEADLAEALTVFLEKNNYSVTTVNDGLSAYDYASSGNFDGIILDIMMSKMNGLEVLSKLRSDGVKTPVMMLTAKGLKDDRIAGFDAGAHDYLPKALCYRRTYRKASRNASPPHGIQIKRFADVRAHPRHGYRRSKSRRKKRVFNGQRV